jgi:hypothetical protein
MRFVTSTFDVNLLPLNHFFKQAKSGNKLHHPVRLFSISEDKGRVWEGKKKHWEYPLSG